MTNFENQAGYTLTNSKLQLVELNYVDEQFILENIDEVYFDEVINFEKDKETKIIAMLQSAYNELLIRKPLNCKSVSFALPLDLFCVMQVPYENSLLHQDLVTEFKWEFSVLFPFVSPKDLAVQYFEVEKNSLVSFNSAIAIAINRKNLQIIHNFCTSNNLKLKFVDNIHLASDRALSLSKPEVMRGLSLSLYLNNKNLSIIFSLNAKPIYFKIIPLLDASEIPVALMNEINNNESISLNKYSISSAFISGDEITDSLVETLRNLLGINFIYFNPFENISPNPKLFENKFYSEKFNAFSSAAGIAYRIG